MDRSKRVVFTAHCILNQNTVVRPLARAGGAYKDVIKAIVDRGIGIHQLDCPEYRHLGLKRMPMTKEEYDTLEYRNLCAKLSEDAGQVLKEYMDNDYEILGIIGINQSPTCSINGVMGIFMEELLSLAEKQGRPLRTIDIPVEYVDGQDNSSFIEELERFLEND